jgi:hypothetical protein
MLFTTSDANQGAISHNVIYEQALSITQALFAEKSNGRVKVRKVAITDFQSQVQMSFSRTNSSSGHIFG